jgi:two-component system sensor histidine kinase VanS
VSREPGLSVRLKLTLSYAGFLMVAGAVLLAIVWVFLLRYVPNGPITGPGPFVPNRGDLIRAFAPAAVWALLFLLAFGLLGGWFLAGRMLAPLSRITDATRLAADGSLSHRIDLEGSDDEFRELADSFDAMLAQLEAHVAEQRRFAANASHELRTPLAITRTLLDVARGDPDRDVDELIRRLSIVNTRAIGLTEALLVLSRADQRSFTREDVDLSLVAEEAAEALLPLAEARGITLRTHGDVTPASGSPALLLQLASNLVHNGIVHNLAEGGTVDIVTSVRSAAAEIAVENTGETLSPHLVSTLVEPFQRGSERIRTDDHAGVGLGLAIVRSIAVAHGGTLTIVARAGGGLRVTVRLPLRQT